MRGPTAMLRPQFFVVFRDRQWKIRHDGIHYGPYATKRDAILAAIEAANKAGGFGHEPRVLVEGSLIGRVQTEWTYGQDPYPLLLCSPANGSPESPIDPIDN